MEKVFEWNEHGVCTNPNELNFDTKEFVVCVKTALYNGLWFVGHTVAAKRGHGCFGSFSPVCKSFKYKTQFQNECAAILSELQLFLKWWDIPKSLKRHIYYIYLERSQLTLF